MLSRLSHAARAAHVGRTAAVRCLATAKVAAARPDLPAAVANESVKVSFPDGASHAYHAFWLRDHCQCPDCFHAETGQRLVDTLKIPGDIRVTSQTVSADGKHLEVTWSDGAHRGKFDLEWLRAHSYDNHAQAHREREESDWQRKRLWDAAMAEKEAPRVTYDEVINSDKGLLKWLRNIDAWGMCLVDGVPASTNAETIKLVERIAFIRQTHFGGFWELEANMDHADTAYTQMALNVHTDNTYFSDPAGLQIFHLVQHDGTGGATTLTDGFRVAEELRQADSASYEILCNTPILSQYIDKKNGIVMQPFTAFPAIIREDDVTNPRGGIIKQIRFNNDDRAPLVHLPPERVPAFYTALRRFAALLRSEKYQWTLQLRPGTVIAVDNQRVLHGRTAFSGYRKLTGCYINGDDYRSRLKSLEKTIGDGKW